MDHPGSRLGEGAAAKAVLGLSGLIGGLLVGAAWAAVARLTWIDAVGSVVKAGVVGSFLGMGAAVVAVVGVRDSLTTVRGLAFLVGSAALLLLLWRVLP